MVTSAQLRAARSLLDWSVRDLAERADVHRNTVSRAETEETEHGHAVAAMVRTLEAAGVIFVEENGEGPGVRLRKIVEDPALPAVLHSAGKSVRCFTLGEAVVAHASLPPDERSAATIETEAGRVYGAQDIAKLYRPAKPKGPATDVVDARDAAIATDRNRRSKP